MKNKLYYWLLVAALGLAGRVGYAQKPTHFYVFVGEKIDVHEVRIPAAPGSLLFDQAFDATYRVLQNVAGGYAQDTIRFRAFDHYGFPTFAKYQHVLLYVSEYDGKLYHEKYQYSPVYKVANGRWAGPYNVGDYDHPFLKETPTQVKLEPLPFGPDASIDISRYSPQHIKTWFPMPYYRWEGGRAVPVQGNYVEDLLELKKEGVLKARGLF